ncbi:MAG: M6 family metalloprotease domain-containing protein [Armatimonadota bacterium]
MIRKQFLVVPILFIVCMTICLLAGVQQASAAPAVPGTIQITQPDGYMINAHIMGDQYQNWIEAENGCAITENEKTGYWEFAVQDDQGNMIPSGVVYQPDMIYPGTLQSQLKLSANQSSIFNPVKNPDMRLTGAWGSTPVTGDRKILVIAVAFANRSALTTPADWNGTFFSTASGAKSLANYFKDNSINKVTISPVAHTQSENPDGVISVTLPTDHPNTRTALNLATETTWANAAIAAASAYIDFEDLDTNLNGILDTDEASIYFIVSGYDASATTEIPSIWSHSTIDFTGAPELTADDLKIRRWSATGERSSATERTRMGVITHEAAHLLFNLPDLFDTTAKTPGLGIFSLMGTGCWGCAIDDFVQGATPVNLDAWSRQYLGWTTPRIPMTTGSMTFGAALASENAPVKLADPRVSTNEYYLIENRPPIGWDAGMARSFLDDWTGGLLVLHIDESIGTPSLNNINHYTAGGHQGVQVAEASTANGSLYLTGELFSDGNKRHLFYNGNNANFTSATTPNSKLYNGTNIGVSLASISNPSASMTAIVTPPAAVSMPTFSPDGGAYETA